MKKPTAKWVDTNQLLIEINDDMYRGDTITVNVVLGAVEINPDKMGQAAVTVDAHIIRRPE